MTRILCALALFMLGFGGHAFADPGLDPLSAQYLLPDGTYSSLCQPDDAKGGTPHDGDHHCDCCIMAVGHVFTPPEPVFIGGPTLRQSEPIRAVEYLHFKRLLSHHRLSRGPPLSA